MKGHWKLKKSLKDKKVTIFEDGKTKEKIIKVPVEMPAQFIINDRELLKIMITPNMMREFAIGFLAAQGFIESMNDIKTELLGDNKAVLYFELEKDIPENIFASAYLNPGCGGGVSFKSLKLPQVKTKSKFAIDNTLELMKEVLAYAEFYKEAGGFHAAGLAVNDKLVSTAEDIGRHNAVDKVIGYGFIEGIDFSKSSLFSTGRVTVEAVAKAARLNIPVLVSRSSPTNLAVALAEKQNITLIGYARGKKAKVYANKERML